MAMTPETTFAPFAPFTVSLVVLIHEMYGLGIAPVFGADQSNAQEVSVS